jgi:hypothetical protein
VLRPQNPTLFQLRSDRNLVARWIEKVFVLKRLAPARQLLSEIWIRLCYTVRTGERLTPLRG